MKALLWVLLAAAPLAMADLEGLASQRAWTELLDKADRVPATERGSRWNELVVSAAVASLPRPGVEAKPFDEARQADGLVSRFSFLGQSAAFQEARGAAVARGLERCLADDVEAAACWKQAPAYEKSLTGAAALQAAKAFVRAHAVRYRPMALFAAAAQQDAAVCGDEDFKAATLAALETPEGSTTARAATSVLGRCWTALEPALKKAFNGRSDAWLKNVCPTMQAKGALTPLQQDLCADAR